MYTIMFGNHSKILPINYLIAKKRKRKGKSKTILFILYYISGICLKIKMKQTNQKMHILFRLSR